MLLSLRDEMPGWLARWRLKRLARRPELASLAALVRALCVVGPEESKRLARVERALDRLCEVLEVEEPRLFVQFCMPGLPAAQLEPLVLAVGRELRFRLTGSGRCQLSMLTERGEQLFRALPTGLRRGFGEVRPWRIASVMACPVCDREGQLERGKNTISGREVHEYYCAACSWMLDDDQGPSLSSLREAARARPAEPAKSARTGEVRLRLTITDVLGFYDDALGTYLGPKDLAGKSTHVAWFRVPAAWLAGDQLARPRLQQLYGFFYGEDWLYSRERTKYLVLESEVKILNPADEAVRPWLADKRVYVTTADGTLATAPAETF